VSAASLLFSPNKRSNNFGKFNWNDSANVHRRGLLWDMSGEFRLDGVSYSLDSVSKRARTLIQHLTFISHQIEEKSNQLALLSKAKNAYIQDLKVQIIKNRSGVDLSEFARDSS
tara:strand:+ start:117 stop:458 length:342 start_codon:yes stop_codon:yes gene_type:complete